MFQLTRRSRIFAKSNKNIKKELIIIKKDIQNINKNVTITGHLVWGIVAFGVGYFGPQMFW